MKTIRIIRSNYKHLPHMSEQIDLACYGINDTVELVYNPDYEQ